MDDHSKDQEDFGTRHCNRCGVLFKRKSRFNFFCPECGRKNSNENVPRCGVLPPISGYNPPAS